MKPRGVRRPPAAATSSNTRFARERRGIADVERAPGARGIAAERAGGAHVVVDRHEVEERVGAPRQREREVRAAT